MASRHYLPVKVIAGNSSQALGALAARELGAPLITPPIAEFADGEARIYVESDLRGANVFIVQSTCTPVNDNLVALALLVDAAYAAGAERITAIVPYFGYSRQDRRNRCGEPRSAQFAGRLLAMAGVGHLVTLDLHSPALESALPMPATLLHAEDVFLARIQEWGISDLVVVSPDAGGMKRAQRYAAKLAAAVAVVAKQRPQPDHAQPLQLLGEVQNRPCLIVDDMASTGRTLAGAAEAVRQAGASGVYGVFTHAVMAPGAQDRLVAANFKKLMTSDSIPVRPKPWLEVASIAPLMAQTVRRLSETELDLPLPSDEREHPVFPEGGAVFI